MRDMDGRCWETSVGLRPRDHCCGSHGALIFAKSPRFFEFGEGAIPDLLQMVTVELNGLDGKSSPHPVEQTAQQPLPGLGRSRSEQRMALRPLRLIGGAIIERRVADPQVTKLLKIRVREAPTATQIEVQSIAEHIT